MRRPIVLRDGFSGLGDGGGGCIGDGGSEGLTGDGGTQI
ncbi:hypothetical protein CcrC1_gp120 [Caulobacter phage C1]|nr:hypothetical protein CcrC1_gp120 [Caulobacter phage C1]UTU08348.1 hypothetical protein CcrC2_gp120 [Caulobacter phage C2]UTU09982.1 hypothetical protein CcrRB23_gp120 [Caulobacter phage RB23]UXY92611.1 hypothetical protein [Caulobacter phage BL47]WGN97007.1 hypothetical protein [Bertelyvirus sp.]